MKKNESARTLTYLIAAGVAIGLALVLSPPGEITPKELLDLKVGSEFFDKFTNPNDATSIAVISYDEASATARRFAVSFQNGKWTIPSHHNYPADGQDRLAKTAGSVKGIKREELATSSKQEHERLGVIDPMDKDRAELKGRGQRLTLRKGEDELVDLIIGKPVKDRTGFYYVRKPGEDATFVAKLDINLSTKFSDWIETDLLKLNRDDLKEIVLDNYSIDKTQGVLIPGDVSKLERDKVADPWKLEGLDEAKEEVDVAKVNGMLGALDDLKIVGVRPKPKGFNPDLSLDPEFVKKQSDLANLARDLQASGFALSMDKKTKQFKLYSDQGDLTASTNKGVTYTLRFGDVFLGDETEIEIGGAADKDAEKKDADKKDGEEKKEGDESGDKAKAKDSLGKQSSRYLFVTASFDETFLGPRPEKPAPPELAAAEGDAPAVKPKQDAAAKAEHAQDSPPEEKSEKKSETKPDSDAKGDDAAKSPPEKASEEKAPADKSSEKSDESCTPPGAGDDEPQKGEEAKPGESDAKQEDVKKEAEKKETDKKEVPEGDTPQEDAKPEPGAAPVIKEQKKSAADLKKEYDGQVKKYEADLKAYEDKVATGKKQVDELNARFGAWYYVISADYFNKLHLARKELVKEKAKPADGKTTVDPQAPPQDEEAGDKPDDAEKDAAEKDTTEKSTKEPKED